MKRNCIFLGLILNCCSLFAQSSDFKFGEIPEPDLLMTSFERDTSADAVVLEAYSKILVSAVEQYPLEQSFIRRIKVLDKSAIKREGDISIPYYSKDGREYIKGFMVSIHNQGEPTQVLEIKDAFVEEVNEYYSVIKVSLPNIKEGTVIDLRYRLFSHFFSSIDKWYFQETIPVRRSVIEADFSKDFSYTYLLNVDESLKVVNNTDGATLYKKGATELKIKGTHFTMNNLPALKKGEPYVTSFEDYLYSVKFQLSQYLSNGEVREHMSSWDLLAKGIRNDPSIGLQYSRRNKYAKLLKAAGTLVYAEVPKMEKLQSLYDFVNNSIKDVGGATMSINSYKIDQAFLESKANSAEMNLMLKALLNEAGIKSKLLFVSTRERGRAIESFPIISQFNFFMLLVTIDDEEYMVDAGNPLRAIGYPRKRALNKRGWAVGSSSNEWIDIVEPKGVDNLIANITVNADGTINGVIKGKYTGYNALPERSGAKSTNEDGKHWKERFEKRYPDTEIDTYSCEHLNNAKEAFKDEFEFSASGAAMVSDDHIYFQPIIYSGFSENQLKSETRNYAVDFNYPIGERSVWEINIPDGYKVEELPESKRFILPKKAGSFTYAAVEKEDGTIQVVSKFDLKEVHFEMSEYARLRELFSIMEEKLSEQIVLVKE